jgi:hypothetical protein
MMKLDCKKILKTHVFIDVVLLAAFLKQDSFQIFLALASLTAGYYIACFISRSRFWRLIMFIVISMVICQISITLKMGQLNEANPTGALVADVAHGFKRMLDFKDIPNEIREEGLCGFLETTNYRYLTMGIFLPFMGISLLLRGSEESKENRLRRK